MLSSEIIEAIRQLKTDKFNGLNDNLLKRRLEMLALKHQIKDISAFINLLSNDEEFSKQVLLDVTPSVTTMFRDPGLFLRMIRIIKSIINHTENLNIWHIGCADGLEVYSLAILLFENNILDKCEIIGSDINQLLIEKARTGKVPMREFRTFTNQYFAAGGLQSLTEYFSISYEQALLKLAIRRKLQYNEYRLGNCKYIYKADIIFCRNMLYYYQPEQQNTMLEEAIDSLNEKGIICFGVGEAIEHLPASLNLHCLDAQFRIYQLKNVRN